jgi:DNA-binding transcriptional MerR regulator
MLRHYDAIGLLRPAQVDAETGYRHYSAAQFSRLNRIVALKDLGFTLEEVASILDQRVSGEEVRGMLRLRQVQLQRQVADDTARLARVQARLTLIEQEGDSAEDEVQVKQIPAVRVAAMHAVADSFEPQAIEPVITPLYEQLRGHLQQAGLAPAGPAVAWYGDTAGGESIDVHAGVPVPAVADDLGDVVTLVDLPAIDQAATIVHRGPMTEVTATLQALARWIVLNGYRSTGYNRELYLEYATGRDRSAWVTELQEPITRGGTPT